MDLMDMRERIDGIDEDIVRLFEERMEISRQVADFKIKTGKMVFDKEREDQKIAMVKGKTHNEFNSHGIEELFTQVMAMSRKLQYQLLSDKGMQGRTSFHQVDALQTEDARVVFQGIEGAYSYAAMREYFGEQVNSFHVETFREAMKSVALGEADFAVLPIENSSAGVVSELYDLLEEYENYIVGEHILKIENVLLGVRGSSIESIKTVYSHPQPLMQCKPYLEGHRDWQQIPITNTAVAAKKVMEDRDSSKAAIASKAAAKCFDLEILEENISFSDSNSTRFIIVCNQKIYEKSADKISICFELPHKSGTLYNILSHFIYNNISMTKIESRPLSGRNWEYRFFIDFQGNLADSGVKNALRGIMEEAVHLKILGNYYAFESKHAFESKQRIN